MDILQKIIKNKQAEISEKLTPDYLDNLAKRRSPHREARDFKAALSGESLSIIAELKKASPSKGLIRPDFDPVHIAGTYQENGAACISVLTEERFFQGHPDFLGQVRDVTNIPILRKDFIIDERQIIESHLLGADAILLIVSALNKERLKLFLEIARKTGLQCLVEIHSSDELEIALQCECEIIGINNRNLSTFETDITTSIAIKENIPENIVTVSESGINTPEDCKLLADHAFNAVLIGETLMRKPNPGAYIPELLEFCQ